MGLREVRLSRVLYLKAGIHGRKIGWENRTVVVKGSQRVLLGDSVLSHLKEPKKRKGKRKYVGEKIGRYFVELVCSIETGEEERE